MEFQNRLYELRKKAGLSQEGLADLLGVTRQAVQKWEAGSSRPDMDNLAALARYFNVTLDYLVTGREPEPYAQEVPTTIINHNYYPRWHYEYKSQRTLFGLPLVHVRLGDRGFGVAKGIFAVGNVAVGLFALGGISLGLFSLGGVSLACCWPWAGCPWAASPLGPVRWDWPPWAAGPSACCPWEAVPSVPTQWAAGRWAPRSPSAAPPPLPWPSGARPPPALSPSARGPTPPW